MANVKPLDVAQWLLLGFGFSLLLKAAKVVDNVFGGLSADAGADHLTPLPGQSYKTQVYELQAERLYAAVWTSQWYEDEYAVMRVLAEMRNTADVVALFNAYGIRKGPRVLDLSGNLYATVRHFLSAEELAAINTFFRRRGIQAAF